MMLGQKYFPAEMTSVSGVQFTADGFIILEQSTKRASTLKEIICGRYQQRTRL
jgi:hypothetical protein